MKISFIPSTFCTLMAFVGHVNAHGFCSKPHASFMPGKVYTNFVATTSASINKGFSGGIYNHAPEENAVQFTKHWNATGYKSLRQMVDTLVPGCGNSNDKAAPVDVTGEREMWWQNNEYKEGFLESHRGPCECWLGETMVFHYDDCRKNFPSYPAKIPVNYSPCKGNCMFRFYWLALHQPTWQVYKNCVPIVNRASGGAPAPGPSPKTPTPAQPSPRPNTPTPAKPSPRPYTPTPPGTVAPYQQNNPGQWNQWGQQNQPGQWNQWGRQNQPGQWNQWGQQNQPGQWN